MIHYIKPLVEHAGVDPQLFGSCIYNAIFIKKNFDLLFFFLKWGFRFEIPIQRETPFEKLCERLRTHHHHRSNNLNNLRALAEVIEKQDIPREHIEEFLIITLEEIYFSYSDQRGEPDFDNAINWILKKGISFKKLRKLKSWGIVWKYYTNISKKPLILLAYYKDSGSLFYKDKFPLDLLKLIFTFLK